MTQGHPERGQQAATVIPAKAGIHIHKPDKIKKELVITSKKS